MKQPHPAIALLGLFLIGSSSLLDVHAAPQREEQRQEQSSRQDQQQRPAQKQQQQQRPQQQQTQKPATQRQAPPKDFSDVHRAFHDRRAQIGAGPALPSGVRIVQGQPLPHGYGKRLDDRALNGLPHYQGYEWRRVGSDIVLVTVATGIVYTILQGVLN